MKEYIFIFIEDYNIHFLNGKTNALGGFGALIDLAQHSMLGDRLRINPFLSFFYFPLIILFLQSVI